MRRFGSARTHRSGLILDQAIERKVRRVWILDQSEARDHRSESTAAGIYLSRPISRTLPASFRPFSRRLPRPRRRARPGSPTTSTTNNSDRRQEWVIDRCSQNPLTRRRGLHSEYSHHSARIHIPNTHSLRLMNLIKERV